MTRKPSEIQAEIEATRRRLEQRLDNLGHDLHPTNLVSSALGTGDGTQDTSEMLAAVAHRAKQNPLGTGLIVAGLAAMFFGRNSADQGALERRAYDPAYAPNRVYANPAYGAPYDRNLPTYDGEGGRPRLPGDPADRVAEDIHALKAQTGALRDRASARAQDLSDQAEAAMDSVKETISDTVDSVRDTVSSAYASVTGSAEEMSREARIRAEQARYQARRSPVVAKARAEQAIDWVRENPVPSGLMALALGATVASFLAPKSQPRSRADAARRLHEEARAEELRPMPVATPVATPATAMTAAAGKATKKKAPTRARSTAASTTKAAARTAKPKTTRAKAASSARGATTSQVSAAASRATATTTGRSLNGSDALQRSTAVLGSEPSPGTNPPANG